MTAHYRVSPDDEAYVHPSRVSWETYRPLTVDNVKFG